MARYDLVITNGIVVDGTGLPRRRADVAVKDGRIAAIGFVDPSDGERVIDARGHVVAPGIVDAHTHYDPQLTFEPYGTSSCYHGVTTVVAGNCGFSVAPLKPGDAPWLIQLFARVEGMDASALEGIPVDGFETFPEFLAGMRGRIGINAAYYVGHCALRRYVMGDAAQEREATPDEIAEMAEMVSEAMAAGAAGFSSTHSPTHLDSADRPVPSRLSSLDELKALVEAAGRGGGGSIAYLPGSAVGGITPDDEELLIELSLLSRMPVIIQGLGARSKVDAPTAGWDSAKRFVDEATARGAAVYSMAMSKPFNRTFDLAAGTKLYEGALALNRLFTEATTVPERLAMIADPAFRDAAREAVDKPNRDPAAGATLPPPAWSVLHVNKVTKPENDKLVGRSLTDIAAERGVHPTDAFLDIAASEELAVEFLWKTETPEWIEGTKIAQDDPHMIVGTSDGGAHLDRDDGAEAHTWFLQHWVREWKGFTLEEGVRQITAIPAALCGFTDRGVLLVGSAADIMIFDPDTVGPDQKWLAHDFPNGAARWTSKPQGVHATIVNGVPIVLDGELQPDAGLPGQVLRPQASASVRGLVWTGELEVRDDVELRSPEPGPTQVLVRIERAGLCHSDVSVIDGTIPFPTPVVLGHEGAGVVEAVGDAVSTVAVGDHVVLTTLSSCGRCAACDRGEPTHCRSSMGRLPRPFTVGGEKAFQFANTGVFAERTVVGENQAVVIPSEVPFEAACLIGCAVVTGVGAVLNRAKVRPGDTVAVIGAGGIGQSVIQGARLAAAGRIVAIDANPAKEQAARAFGATDFVDATAVDDVVAAVKDLGLPNGVDHAFECVGHPALIRSAIDMLDWHGQCVMLGVPKAGTEASFVVSDMYNDKAILGCRYGATRPHHDIPVLVGFYLDGRLQLDEMVSQVYDLGDVGQALDDLHHGKLNRGVLRVAP